MFILLSLIIFTSCDIVGMTPQQPDENKKEVNVKIARLPNKTSYYENEELDFTGLVVKLYFDDESSETINDYEIIYDNLVLGNNEITIKYKDFFDSFTIEINKKEEEPVIIKKTLNEYLNYQDQTTINLDYQDYSYTLNDVYYGVTRKANTMIVYDEQQFIYTNIYGYEAAIDKYGMVVFQDMINSGKYDFLVDTALPTVGLKRGITHKATKGRKEAFYRSAEGIVKELYNHPCVCYYTIFNEGWGQFEADQCYSDIKAMDPTRIFDTTSGWFQEQLSDVDSEHIYFKPVQLKIRQGRPMVLSEFGGYSCKIEGHAFNLDKTYGYRYFSNTEDFEKALVELYEKEILPLIPKGLCAAVLTQVSDVEDETNGLLTYDRQVLKVNPEVMKGIAERMQL